MIKANLDENTSLKFIKEEKLYKVSNNKIKSLSLSS
jgi:hypothetical protein